MKRLLIFILFTSQFIAHAQVNNDAASAINQFGFEAFKQMSLESDFLISPYSISVGMMMTYLGASGETQKQLEEVFYFKNDTNFFNDYSKLSKNLTGGNGPASVLLANKLFPDYNKIQLNEEFISDNEKYFNTTIEGINYNLPYEAAQRINDWVSKNTDGNITNLVEPSNLSSSNMLFLLNAIHYKANWANPFDSLNTQIGMFTNDKNEEIEVDYMHTDGEYLIYLDEDFQVLNLPYQQREFSLLLFLPTDSMKNLENKLNNRNLFNWAYGGEVLKLDTLQIPKFKVSYKKQMKNVLTEMGLPDLFSNTANFSKMSNSPKSISLSSIIHKTFLDVNENGTEASAATAIGTITRGIHKPANFIVDRPFMYMIRHNSSNTILFIGKCSNPIYKD